jgi:myo-inositol-1(or 4)-monophosphatase
LFPLRSGFWEERLNSWDMMAGKVMIEEAGGRVTRFDGRPLGLAHGEIVASNGALHPALLEVLRQEREESASPAS